MPIFGGWLRYVEDEQMHARLTTISGWRSAPKSRLRYSLLAELNLNDIKGSTAPVLECGRRRPRSICHRQSRAMNA